MKKLVTAIKENSAEVKKLVAEKPDWSKAEKRFDAFFKHLSNPKDALWSEANFKKLKEVYAAQKAKDKDKGMSNITIRTVSGMPANLKNDTKKIFLQTAEVCLFFNASHKVNFDAEEIPTGFDQIKMIPGKAKGTYTYAEKIPSLYPKISLTFDYWMPKIFDWADEIRAKNLKDWKGETILEHESCSDFMRICLLFLSDIKKNPPIAKAEDREALLKLIGEEFVWVKKAAKREDIPGNNKKLSTGLNSISKRAGIDIPLEAWSRILQAPFIKSIIK